MLAALLGGCGGFDNQPLRRGVVTGQIDAGENSDDAVISVLEDYSRREDAEDDGSFEIELEHGEWNLFVFVPPDRATIVPVTVRAGEWTNLSTIQVPHGVTVRFELQTSGDDVIEGAKVAVLGTGLEEFESEDDTFIDAFPLAPGCFQARVTASGLDEVLVPFCVAAGDAVTIVPVTFAAR